MNGILFSVGIVSLFFLGVVESTGKLTIKLYSYDNVKGTTYDDACCDSDVKKCMLDKCDLKFDICVGKHREGYDCTYGTKQVISSPDMNSIEFTDVFDFEITNSLKEDLYIRVNVTDQDSDLETDLVDAFHSKYSRAAFFNSSVAEYMDYFITGERKTNPTRLNFSLASYCDQNYYGEDCSINCVPEDFGCSGHYRCRADGAKICLPGWRGPNCDIQIPGGEGDCGFYKDSNELLPSLWMGTYSCPDGNTHTIQVNVTQREVGSILTTAVLTYEGISTTATGTFGHKTLNIQSNENKTSVILYASQPATNLTTMNGDFDINGTKCLVTLNMQKSYFNYCGTGTCVRYGQQRDDYYCCCSNSNKAKDTCVTTTTAGVTSSTTTSTTTTPKTTTTIQVTTEEPTTQKPTTQKPTTQKPTTKSTTLKTTTTSTTTTPQPTSPETTSTPKPTTEPTTKSTTTANTRTTMPDTTEATTVITKQSTTQPSTTTMASSPSKVVTTVKPLTPSASPVQVFLDSFLINLLDNEIDSSLTDAIEDAFVEANQDKKLQKKNIEFPDLMLISKYVYEKRKHRGELLTLVRYNISISGISAIIHVPTKHDIQVQIGKYYTANVRIYKVAENLLFPEAFSFQLNVFGPGPGDNQMTTWEKVILDVFNAENKCNSQACQLNSVSIKCTDEYLDYKGREVTRLYVYIFTGTLAPPPNNTGPYIRALQNHPGIKATFYSGSLDLHDLLWYRHHYDLFIEGSVDQSDLPEFARRIQNAWYLAEPGYYCTLCNASIHRIEKYVGENGESLTAIVYFFKVRQIFSLPNMDGNYNYTQYINLDKLTDVNGNQYKLYKGTKQYRYKHAYNLLIEGKADPKDRNQFIATLKQAWLDYNASLTSINPSYLIEEYVSSSGDLVSNIVCFVSLDDLEMDARLIPTPSMSWLHQWRMNQSNLVFTRAGGQAYQVYTKYSLSQLFIRTDLFSMYFEGYLKLENWIEIQKSLQSAWNSTNFSGKNISVQILRSSTYSVYLKRETVTLLWYSLHVDGKLVPPFTVLYNQRTLVYNISMVSLASRYPVYVLFKDRLLDRGNQFTLYFTTKINYLDFDLGLKNQLLSIIKRKWKDSSNYKNLDLYIDFQEKVYGTDSMVLWKLVFYLTSNQLEIQSQFVSSIMHHLFQSEEIMGISGHLYHLYKGQMSSTWLSYNNRFSLTFGSEVSRLDWLKVKQTLTREWCRGRFVCGKGQDITVTIKEQEQYWNDITRQWYWQLVYFVHYGNHLISSQSYTSIDTSKLDFSWTNVYNGTYHLVQASSGMWKFSRSFHLWTEEHLTINTEAMDKIRLVLLQAWFKMNVRSDLRTCNCISVHILPQQRYYAGNGKSLWKLTYFILYKGKVVMDAHLWPALNTALIDWSTVTSQEVKVKTDIDLYYYQYMLKFSLNHKLSISEYGKVEKALTQEYTIKHPECGCHVSIAHQEEVIDSQGKSSWIVYYHLVKNGTYQNPSSYSPINWGLFSSKHNFTSVDGHKLDFSWSWYGNNKFVGYSQSGGLFLQTWVPPSLYGKFAAWLEWYYRKYFKDSTVYVEMTNTTREYKKKDGSSVWHLPFILKVNGSIVTPPSINSTTFETTFNTTSQWKLKFTLVHTEEVTDKHKVFSVLFNHKVSEPAKEEIKKAIIDTFVQQHPGVNSSLVNLTFGNQQETFSGKDNETTGKSSSWELSYTISVGGSTVDSRSTTSLNTSLLTSNLNVTGPNNVKYRVITNTEAHTYIAASRVSSLYIRSFVSVEDIKKMEEKIALAWKQQYNSSEEVKVTFIRQKQYVDSNGEVVWKWDYTLRLNSSHLVRAEIPPVDHTHLQVSVGSLVSVTGNKYQLVQSSVNFLDYQMHFPLYLTTKMAKENGEDFKKSLEETWAKKGLGAVSVHIVKQEEIIDKTTGVSSWKLVYFLKHKLSNTVVDSRVTENINASHLFPVVGPRGVYRYRTHLDISQHLSKSMSKSIAINTKLDIKGRATLGRAVAELLKSSITETTLKGSISVEIAGQEEYYTKQNGRAWRILYFVRLGGDYVPATSLVSIDQNRLVALLSNFTTSHSQRFQIIKDTDLLHSYRNAFSVYFTSKVAVDHFLSIQQSIVKTWEKSTVYTQCNCLSVDGITENLQEEVIDSNGVSYWKLNYFLRSNGSVVESMTHMPLDLEEISKVLTNVTNVKGKPYQIKVVTGTVVRSRMMFSFHMTTEIGYMHKEKFQSSLKAAWIRMQPDILKDREISVRIYRNTRFVDILKRNAVWQVDYVVEKSNIKVDPLEIPPLPVAELQKNITFLNPRGVPYQVVDKSTGLVDYRMHFALFISVEVKSADFDRFSTALEQYWASKEGYTNSSATVYFQERYVNSYGKMLWKLVIFMKKGSAFLDSRTSESVNTSRLQSSITAVDSRGHKYQLVDDRSNTLRRYDAGFSLLLSRTVLRSDLIHVSNVLKETWTGTEVGLKNITIEVVSQENYYTSKMGLTSKILYFLSVDGSWVDSGMLGKVNTTILQQKLTFMSTSHKYELVVVAEEDLYKYEWLFTLDMLVPLLSVDYNKMKSQLAAAWMVDYSTNFKNLTLKILHQENLISGHGVPVNRILYSMNGDSIMQKATQRSPLSFIAMMQKVTLQMPGTSYRYIDKLYGGGSDLFRYTDLFSLHFVDRVANFSLLESQLKEAWNSTVNVEGEKIAKVTIVGQEKILLNNGESAFRVLYHVESRNQDYTINRPLILGPSHDALVKHVKVEGPTGVAKRLLNVTEGFRMSQVFSVVLNRQVFMTDLSKFESSLLNTLQRQWTDVSSNLSFTVRSKERVIEKNSREMLWRYSYVVISNGRALDVSRQYGVNSTTLTSNLNFISPSKGNYEVVNKEVGAYREMFSLQIENIQSTFITQKILEELRKMWKGSVRIAGDLLREEYVSIEGAPITKLSYFVEESSGLPVYPSVTKPPPYDSLATSLGVRLITGKSTLRYSDCYRLYVNLPQWTVDKSSIQTALTQVWTTHSPATKNITINLVNGMDAFVGSYGLRLSALLYTISYQSTGQSRVMTPDIMVHPESDKVQTALSSQNSKLTVYRSSPLRKRSLFHISLVHLRNATMSVSHVQSLSAMIKVVWNSMVQEKVETAVVFTEAYRTLNGRSRITRLYYHIKENNKTVEPWEDKVQPSKFLENLAKLLQNDSSLMDDFMLSSQTETKVYTLFIQGHLKDFSDIHTAIQRSWQQSSVTGSVVVTTHSVHKYVSDEWSDVTKLAYTVTINGSSPETLKISPPSFDTMEAELKKVNKAQCPCYAKKAQKEYLLGTKTSITVIKIQEALKSAWTKKNPGIQGQKLMVRIKDVASRQKRETDSATIKTKLVGKDNKEITPVHYMVALDGHDPDPNFVDTPTSNDLAQPLNQAGAPPCGCSPKLAGSFKLKGATNPSDKGKITDAIADAFAKENKDVDKNDIKADAKLNNTKSNGEDVTVVDYTVQRNDDEAVENLNSPKRVDLERSLSTVGKTLYSKAPAPPPEEEDDKRLAIYIAVGVVAFLILVMVVCYIAYIRRRRKKGNLLKREQTVKENNFFDTEHFSEPAASHTYQNPNYEPNPVKQDLRNV